MSDLPRTVLLREDGPREGFQMLAHSVPTEKKLELIERLSGTGIKSIEVTSFVRPDRVPQLADAAELAAKLKKKPGLRYRALYLNEKGLRRALEFSQLQPEGYVLLAASETFLKKNSNISLADAIAGIDRWIALFESLSLPFERVMISTAFGDNYEGFIPQEKVLGIVAQVLDKLRAHGSAVTEITYADTTGWANPNAVTRLVCETRSRWPELPLGLHFHDTRGCGMANVYAGLQAGIDRFDCSVGGLGGCPFAKGAAGNVPTEDVAFLCQQLGIQTGLDLERYIDCARFAETLAGKPLPGKLKDGGLPTVKSSTL